MPQTTTNNRPRRRKQRLITVIFRWFTIGCLIVLGATIGLFAGLYFSVANLVPNAPGGLEYRPSDATRIYSSDGVLLARLFEQNRDVIKIQDVPKDLQNATVAIEDKRFYQHIGFDPMGIIRAAFSNVLGGGFSQGASTITQQLARNVYLSRKKTLSRKVQEIALAVALERKFSKQQILEMYLNEVFYGSGANGVEAAAQTYFGKPAKRLTLGECALIAGLTQRPSGYSPFNDIEAARGRRRVVLSRMVEEGYITPSQAEQAKTEAVHLAPRRGNTRWKAPYFVNYVIQQLGDEYGESALYHAGLQVYTTLDYKMQQAAENAVKTGVESNRSRRVTQGALISMDPKTGSIRAMVGGVDYTKRQYNVVSQGHPQPGSTFKPIVYTAALENGYSIYDRIVDDRQYLRGRNKPPWPSNYDNRYHGRVTLITAIAQSYNVPVVKIAKAIGVDEIIRYARALGIVSRLPEDLTLALGSASLTPLEMATVYCAFANGGEAVKPLCVAKITTGDGGSLPAQVPSKARVMRETTAEGIDTMLRAVVTRGTGYYVNRRVSNARGKTGTTDEDRHAWFIGYTPELVTAVWVGNDIPVPMHNVWGGNVCAPIWSSFMRTAVPLQQAYLAKTRHPTVRQEEDTRGQPRQPRRDNRSNSVTLTICDESGMTASRACPKTHRQTFPRSEAPSALCDIHGVNDSSAPPDQVASDVPADYSTNNNDAKPGERNETPQPAPPASSYVTVLICADSHLLANRNCPHIIRQRFREDLTPTQVCGRH